MRIIAAVFDECDYEAREFFGFLEIHEVAGVIDDDAARIGIPASMTPA